VRPIFLRNLNLKTGNEVLQLFEQIRKNVKLNRAAKNLPPAEKHEALMAKKREFYDGLLRDLIGLRAYALAQIVYSEKMREKFEPTVQDQLTGLEIFASQKKIEEFSELYLRLLALGEKKETAAQLSQAVCESIAANLMLFDNEKERQRRLEMAERLFRRILENSVSLSGRLFDSLVFVFTESQQWRQLIDVLAATSARNCTPEAKTLHYLKKNLLYCFEPTTRGLLKEQIERLEDTFFPPQPLSAATASAANPQAPQPSERRQARQEESAEEGKRGGPQRRAASGKRLRKAEDKAEE